MKGAVEIIIGFIIGAIIALITYVFLKNMYAAIAFGTVADAVVLKLFKYYK